MAARSSRSDRESTYLRVCKAISAETESVAIFSPGASRITWHTPPRTSMLEDSMDTARIPYAKNMTKRLDYGVDGPTAFSAIPTA